MIKLKNILTENLQEIDTYTASTQGPFNQEEIKIYDQILNAIEICLPNVPADAIDDFTDNYNKDFYIKEFKKIIQDIKNLANTIDDEMSQQAG